MGSSSKRRRPLGLEDVGDPELAEDGAGPGQGRPLVFPPPDRRWYRVLLDTGFSFEVLVHRDSSDIRLMVHRAAVRKFKRVRAADNIVAMVLIEGAEPVRPIGANESTLFDNVDDESE